MHDDIWLIWAASEHRGATYWVGEATLEAALATLSPVLVAQADQDHGERTPFEQQYFPRDQWQYTVIKAERRCNAYNTPNGTAVLIRCAPHQSLLYDTTGT